MNRMTLVLHLNHSQHAINKLVNLTIAIKTINCDWKFNCTTKSVVFCCHKIKTECTKRLLAAC